MRGLAGVGVALAVLWLSGAVAADDGTVVAGELGKRLDRAVGEGAGGPFWGTVLVARRGKVLLAKGYGFADYEKRPNTPRTLFEVASTSKQFTAAAILKLHMTRKLRITDPIRRYVPVKLTGDKARITIRHLLTHTSGIPQNIGLPYASTKTRRQFLEHVLAPALVSKPGEKFAYNNSGYALLAAIVERASKQSFEAYSRKVLFKPAKMTDTGFVNDGTLDARRTTVRRSERTVPGKTAIDWYWSWGYRGMGGVVTTAYDMLAWDRALRGASILDAPTRKLLHTPALAGYACGWKVETTARGTRKAHHSGSVAGYRAHFVRYLEDDATIVIQTNGKGQIFGVEQALSALLFPPPMITAQINHGAHTLSQWQAVRSEVTRWSTRRDGDHVVMTLHVDGIKTASAVVRMPAGYAAKVAADIDGMLAGKKATARQGVSTGLYLGGHKLAGKTLELTSLQVVIRPKYDARDKDGKAFTDDRLLMIVSAGPRQWPIMSHLDLPAAKALRDGLRKAAKDR